MSIAMPQNVAAPARSLTVPPLEMPRLCLGHRALRGRHRRLRNVERPENRHDAGDDRTANCRNAPPPGRRRGLIRHAARSNAPDASDARLEHLAAIGTSTARAGTEAGAGPYDAPTAVALRHPPKPPVKLTPALACDPNTELEILWHIARNAPELRRWLVANPRSGAELLEYVAQAGGPGVHETIAVLLDLLDRQQRPHARRRRREGGDATAGAGSAQAFISSTAA
ncbi:hypothetical protein G1C96_1189 [Bifidobacterium sp. DSM 109958]|uniref:Leucine rich repeat variant domain-containing protein n=1 Tax=Bifidobacterium moraviense TaxID=2675323 RepID=A0A7Y0HZU9_9BIFI|nr:hypothetical protein [Bifidobacterium sp. DSM 109958]NMN00610.1 hypothetical protein [Bifidobacterium sp. DSM 109958]